MASNGPKGQDKRARTAPLPTVDEVFRREAGEMATEFGVAGVLLSQFVSNYTSGRKWIDMVAYLGFSCVVSE
jgi:hypothetical protein